MQWVELYEEAKRLEHAELQIRIQLFLAVHLFEQGNIDLAFRALDTAQSDCERQKVPMLEDTTLMRAFFHARAGETDRALKLIEDLCMETYAATINVTLGWIHLFKSQLQQAQSCLVAAERHSAQLLPFTGARIRVRQLKDAVQQAQSY